jgi:catalase (peroxidase I)
MVKKKEFWEKPNPAKKSKSLSASQKKAAKARAARAGRSYPNLVDNAWASRKKK